VLGAGKAEARRAQIVYAVLGLSITYAALTANPLISHIGQCITLMQKASDKHRTYITATETAVNLGGR
jgi:hypothetical protein